MKKRLLIIKDYISKDIIKNIRTTIIINAIFIFLDYYNIISQKLNHDIKYIECIILYVIICLIILTFCNIIKPLLNEDKYNYLDKCILIVFPIILLNTIWCMVMNHKLILHIITISILIVIIYYRSIKICNTSNIYHKTNNLISLSELINIKTIPAEEQTVIIKEEPIDDLSNDILDFETTISNLLNFITNCRNDKSFVIGLVGEWGTGKTSILNIVEKRLSENKKTNNIEIIKISTWQYENVESILIEVYNKLTKIINYKTKIIDFKKIINKYKNITIKYIGIEQPPLLIDIFKEDIDSFYDIKQEISSILEKIDKEIIIIFDDLDRISTKQLKTILSIIDNIISFNRIKIILCYDEKIIEEILKNSKSYDIKYIDKVVNAKIRIPSIDRYSFKTSVKSAIYNYLKINRIVFNKNNYYLDSIIDIISSDLNNTRDLIRFLNSLTLNLETQKKYQLFLPDFIGMEYIKYSNEKLYKNIYNNISIFTNNNKTNSENRKNIFLDSNATKFQKDLINSDLFNEYHKFNPKKDKMCISVDYFYAFFGNKSTKYSAMNDIVMKFIKTWNEKNDTKSILKKIITDKSNIQDYNEILINNIEHISDKKNFIKILQDKKTLFIKSITVLLEKLQIDNSTKFIDACEYKDIALLSGIVNHYNNNGYSETGKKIMTKAHNKLSSLVNQVIKNNIDIFSDGNYENGNLIDIVQNTDNKEIIKEYLDKILNNKNVLRILYDLTFETSTNQNSRKISFFAKTNSDILNYSKIDTIVNDIAIRGLNEKEKMVVKAYEEGEAIITNIILFEKSEVRYKDFTKKSNNANKTSNQKRGNNII